MRPNKDGVHVATSIPHTLTGDDLTEGNEIEGDKELEELEEDEVDLRCYTPTGGIIHLDLYTLPPLSKTVQEWTLKQGTYTSNGLT